MQFLYDNLIATVVGMTVFLILVSIQMRATRTSVAQSARSMALKQAETLATWMEQDLEAMGRNLDDSETVYEVGDRTSNKNSPTESTLASGEALKFYYDKKTIRYNVEADPQTIDGKPRTLYEFERTKNGASAGGSPTTLGYFDIRFIDENAEPTTDESKIRGIRVHFSVVSPFQNDETTLQEIHRMVVVPYAPNRD